MSRASVQINFRVPEEIVLWLEDRAKTNRRTRQSEMIYIFETIKKKEEGVKCEKCAS